MKVAENTGTQAAPSFDVCGGCSLVAFVGPVSFRTVFWASKKKKKKDSEWEPNARSKDDGVLRHG